MVMKRKFYYNTRFNPKVIKAAHDLFLEKQKQIKDSEIGPPQSLVIVIGDETWDFDFIEEFLALLPKANRYTFNHIINDNCLRIDTAYGNAEAVVVEFPQKAHVDAVFQVFEDNLEDCKIKTEDKLFNIFIGHGHDKQWQELKNHLQDKHQFLVQAYEVGQRGGQPTKDILKEMLEDCSLAFLVFTGEDIDIYGKAHARDNVIHELGLFQGKLGFKKAIVLLEEDVQVFSNIEGINQLRFSKGNIKEIFGDVVSVITREIRDYE